MSETANKALFHGHNVLERGMVAGRHAVLAVVCVIFLLFGSAKEQQLKDGRPSEPGAGHAIQDCPSSQLQAWEYRDDVIMVCLAQLTEVDRKTFI